MSDKSNEQYTLTLEEQLAAMRDEWRRRYAGVALEGLAGTIPIRLTAVDDPAGTDAQAHATVLARLSILCADALLAALDAPPEGK